MPRPLLLSRRFAPLFWCQFFAAFNDNFLKTALVFVILFHSDARDAEALITLASAVFIAPYFLFVRARRRTCGSLRQGAGRATAEIRRNLRRRAGGMGLRAVVAPAAVCRAVRLRRPCGAIRADQIRHPSGPPATRSTCPPAMRWWKVRPSSPSCSARSLADWPRAARATAATVCRAGHGLSRSPAGCRAFDSGDRRGRAASQDRQPTLPLRPSR